MPKLLIVTTVASTLEGFLLPYARHFRSLGWRVDALARGAASSTQCLDAFNACHEAAFTRAPWKLRGTRRMEKAIRSLVSQEGYDIVHVHTPVASFVTRSALRWLPQRERPAVVYTAHGFHFYKGGNRLKNALFLGLERMASRWTDRLITINDEDYAAARFHFPMPPGHVLLMPGIGLDLGQWDREAALSQGGAGVREELGLGPDAPLFLMVAEFIPRKRHQDALKALAMSGRGDFHLALAGTGPLEEDTRALARKLGIASQVHFLGHRGDIAALMTASLATILSSEQEGLSRSVMESIALGVPVLGADVRGIRELITESSRGELFPVKKPAALAAAMLTEAGSLREGRPRPDPAWDIKNLLGLHETLYEELLEERLMACSTSL